MENRYLLLNDVARILGLKAHQIAYALATGQVAEPALRVANKRVFSTEDVERPCSPFQSETEMALARDTYSPGGGQGGSI